ncbi:hypothetical protein LCGC14_3081500 [marine sediment metagenome]|uniref:PD-(D/E)XK endonuclease-like domain-containing protein n=1 Tax=marine sediment metagenome TaxID=412755 RepID=A0A0F8WD39_9ZZZZ
MQVSASKIKVFGDCANQFKYQHVLKLPGQQWGALTVIGTVFHYAVEVYELYADWSPERRRRKGGTQGTRWYVHRRISAAAAEETGEPKPAGE